MAEVTRRPRYLTCARAGVLRVLSERSPTTAIPQLSARFKVRRDPIYRDLRIILAEATFPARSRHR